jgi:hypothetical protein
MITFAPRTDCLGFGGATHLPAARQEQVTDVGGLHRTNTE